MQVRNLDQSQSHGWWSGKEDKKTVQFPFVGDLNRGFNAIDLLPILSFNNKESFYLSIVLGEQSPPLSSHSLSHLSPPPCRDEILEVHLKILRFLCH